MKRIFTIILMFAALTFAVVSSSHVSIAQSDSALTDFVPSAIIPGENCSQGFNCGRIADIDFVGETDIVNIYTMNRDGSERRLVISFDPPGNNSFGRTIEFSPDNRKLLFTSNSYSSFDQNIWTVNVDGTGLTDLTQSFSYNKLPVFSPDGTKIAFLSSRDTGNQFNKIYIMNSDGSDVRRLTDVSLAYDEFSPSFSPDGSKIVFMLYQLSNAFRDIYTIGTDGAGLTNLTNTEATLYSNVSPAYTPDGNSIIFVSGRDYGVGTGGRNEIYRMNADGSGQIRLTNLFSRKGDEDESLIVSPDGNRVLFDNSDSIQSDKDVYLVGTDGSGLTNLSNEPDKDNFAVQFSPDGSKVGFTTYNSLSTADIVNIDGSNRVTISDPVESRRFGSFGKPDTDNDGIIDGADNCPFTANSFRVAFSSIVDIWAMNADGTNLTRLTTNPATDDEPSFSADGKKILFTSNRSNSRDNIFVMNADGSNQTQITNVAGGTTSDGNNNAVFNPSGTKIAFIGTRRISGNTHRNLFLMNPDGTNQTQLTFFTTDFNFAANPNFNQDGTRIVFDSQRGNISISNQDIYTINPDSTNETRLTTATAQDTDPSYNRDGSKIVFLSRRDGNSEVYTMNADGTNQTRLTNTTDQELDPTFTPDGAKIAFRRFSDQKLYLMNADGTDVRRISTAAMNFNEIQPTFAPQPDADGDGIGDACDGSFDVNTPTGANVGVQTTDATISFSNVSGQGTTSFAPITPDPASIPTGYALCPTCPAYNITTTANYTPPIKVCLAVPAAISQTDYLNLQLLHGENGVFVNRTTEHTTNPGGQRLVCGEVSSLSPFILAQQLAPTAAQVLVSGRVKTANGRGIPNTVLTLTGSDGSPRIARTNPFGYYRFNQVDAGENYVLSISSKSYTFTPSTLVLSIAEDLTNIDFVSESP